MNFDSNFRKLGCIQLDGIKSKVEALTEAEWGADSWRQEKYKIHRWTQTISLAFDLDFRHENPTIYEKYYEFEEDLKPVFEQIKTYYSELFGDKENVADSYFIRINLVKLLAKGEIPAHNDKNFSLTHGHRIHIPIITNDQVMFTVAEEKIAMPEGEIWEINNKKIHYVENLSDHDRVHMIIDWVIPGERCCCSLRLRPDVPCSPQACQQTDYSPIVCQCLS